MSDTEISSEPNLVIKKICSMCILPVDIDEFRRNGRKPSSICKPCHRAKDAQAKRKRHVRSRLRHGLSEAPYIAAMRVLQEDPELLLVIHKKRPGLFEEYLRQERVLLAEETRKNAVRFWNKLTDTEQGIDIWEKETQAILAQYKALRQGDK